MFLNIAASMDIKLKIKTQRLFFKNSLCILILFLTGSCTLWGQQVMNIDVTDCERGAPLSGVYVIDGSGKLLAETDASGHCHFTLDKWPLFLKRQSYQTLIIYEPKDMEQQICLMPAKKRLQEVKIQAKKENLQKYLLQLRNKNLPWFMSHDTTTYYKFSYSLQFPDKNWEERATGVVAYHWQRHKSDWTEVDYLQYHYSSTDTGFWNSQYYQEVHPQGICHVLNFDLMGNAAGYQLWKRFVGKENRGLRIPIPKFMLSSEQRELVDKIVENPEKYHLPQYGSEERELILQLDSADNRIFFTHYSNYDTTGYIAEKIVFDSLDRLKNVYYYTPENLSSKYFTLDSATLSTVSRQSKINNDSSYYYSSYTYGVDRQPILLNEARHLEMFYVHGLQYRVSVEISLLDTIPPKDFELRASYYSMENRGLDSLEKGEEILNAIREQQYSTQARQ